MDTRKECIDVVKKIVKSYNFDVSFIEGDLLDYFSTVSSKEGVISFPALQEAFLILFELDNGERILIFILIILMMENDDYELCEELLTNLEEKGLPPCSDSQALYENILIKQLFIILHECGHIYIEKDKSKKIELYENLCKIINETFQDVEMDDWIIDEIVKRTKVFGGKSEKISRELLLNTDYSENSALYLSKSINIEESLADRFSMICLKDFFREKKSKINKDKIVKSIYEAIVFFTFLHNFKELLILQANHNDEDYFKIIADTKYRLNVNQIRFSISILFLDDFFETNSIDLMDLYFDSVYKPYSFLTDDKDKYFDAWASGNKNLTNQSTRDVVLKRIMNYVNTLKELYQQDDKNKNLYNP